MLTFAVHGRPAGKGSTRAVMQFTRRKGWQARTLAASKRTAPWQLLVRDGAAQARARQVQAAGLGIGAVLQALYPAPTAVHVVATFILARPQRARRLDAVPSNRVGDIDKLLRCVLDALTGVLYDDDAQVVCVTATKQYAQPGERTGAVLLVLSHAEAEQQALTMTRVQA